LFFTFYSSKFKPTVELKISVSQSRSELEQWDDYQFGLILGWNLTKKLGIFVEGEYTKFWDTEIFNSTVGLNLEL